MDQNWFYVKIIYKFTNLMKYFYTYKITCTAGSLKNKIYFGKHVTTNLEDGYKGSGVILKKYFQKYPKEYIIEILNFYNNTEELNDAEIELIKPHLGKEYCLNIANGGHGGDTYTYNDHKEKFLVKGMLGKHHSEETKRKIAEKLRGKPSGAKGKHLSEETKRKIADSKRGKKRVYDENLQSFIYK